VEGVRRSIFNQSGRHPDDSIGCVIERGQGFGGRPLSPSTTLGLVEGVRGAARASLP
jgi:hypothetical protein